jgi:hypothetical protein
LLKAIRHHTDCPWALLYIERWLKAPAHEPTARESQKNAAKNLPK